MEGDWIEAFERSTGAQLDVAAHAFLVEVGTYAPTSQALWGHRAWRAGAKFERLAVEGTADTPRLVCYFRDESRRPGLLIAFEWPVADMELGSGSFDWSVWMANLMELVDEAGCTLPTVPGPDGVARTGAV